MSVRTYTELISLPTFEERFRYLKLDGKIGEATFGFQRWVNQEFYHSSEWLSFRDDVIIRDNGCDLGIAGHEIFGPVLIHHINPITYEDIINRNPCVFDLENVICTQLKTHNAIHYGDESILILKPVQRSRNDTCPWRKKLKGVHFMSTMYEDVDMENPDGVSGDGSDVCDGLIGVVVNCLSLNIREKASADSNVIAEAKALDELKIDMTNSNDDWYAVCTVAGIEGFCMKKFIAVRE